MGYMLTTRPARATQQDLKEIKTELKKRWLGGESIADLTEDLSSVPSTHMAAPSCLFQAHVSYSTGSAALLCLPLHRVHSGAQLLIASKAPIHIK